MARLQPIVISSLVVLVLLLGVFSLTRTSANNSAVAGGKRNVSPGSDHVGWSASQRGTGRRRRGDDDTADDDTEDVEEASLPAASRTRGRTQRTRSQDKKSPGPTPGGSGQRAEPVVENAAAKSGAEVGSPTGGAASCAPQAVTHAPGPTSKPRRPVHMLLAVSTGYGVEAAQLIIGSAAKYVQNLHVAMVLDTRARNGAIAWWESSNEGVKKLKASGMKLHLYSFEALDALIPRRWDSAWVNVRRFWLKQAVLEDFATGGKLLEAHPGAVTLHSHPVEQPDAVLMADMKDSIFQDDPFVQLWQRSADEALRRGWITAVPDTTAPFDVDTIGRVPSLVAAQESTHMPLGQCKFNRKWVDMCYGGAMVEAIASQPIYCCGTILGTWTGTMIYLREAFLPGTEMCSAIEGEQGVHNALLHPIAKETMGALLQNRQAGPIAHLALLMSQKLHILVAEAEGDWVCTVGYLKGTPNLRKDAEGFVISKAGKRCALVHQYDRIDGQQRIYEAYFAGFK